MSPNPQAPNIPEGTSGKKTGSLCLYSLSKRASSLGRVVRGWDEVHLRPTAVRCQCLTAHRPPGSRRSLALDSNPVVSGPAPGGAAGASRGARVSCGARTDPGVCTLGSRPQAPAARAGAPRLRLQRFRLPGAMGLGGGAP